MLENIAEHQEGRSLRELVEDLSIPRTGVYRIATTLANLEYLDYNRESGRYCLTRKLLALGNNSVCSESIISLTLDEMYNLLA